MTQLLRAPADYFWAWNIKLLLNQLLFSTQFLLAIFLGPLDVGVLVSLAGGNHNQYWVQSKLENKRF